MKENHPVVTQNFIVVIKYCIISYNNHYVEIIDTVHLTIPHKNIHERLVLC